MKTTIYCLKDPYTFEVKYVGKTRNPEQRKKAHNSGNITTGEWVMSIQNRMKPLFEIIEECEYEIEDKRERHFVQMYSGVNGGLINKSHNPKIIRKAKKIPVSISLSEYAFELAAKLRKIGINIAPLIEKMIVELAKKNKIK